MWFPAVAGLLPWFVVGACSFLLVPCRGSFFVSFQLTYIFLIISGFQRFMNRQTPLGSFLFCIAKTNNPDGFSVIGFV